MQAAEACDGSSDRHVPVNRKIPAAAVLADGLDTLVGQCPDLLRCALDQDRVAQKAASEQEQVRHADKGLKKGFLRSGEFFETFVSAGIFHKVGHGPAGYAGNGIGGCHKQRTDRRGDQGNSQGFSGFHGRFVLLSGEKLLLDAGPDAFRALGVQLDSVIGIDKAFVRHQDLLPVRFSAVFWPGRARFLQCWTAGAAWRRFP